MTPAEMKALFDSMSPEEQESFVAELSDDEVNEFLSKVSGAQEKPAAAKEEMEFPSTLMGQAMMSSAGGAPSDNPLPAALQVADAPAGVLRTAYNVATKDGDILDILKQSAENVTQTGFAPSTGSLLLDIALDPAVITGGVGLAKAGYAAGKAAAPALMRQAYRPAATKLAEEGAGDLGEFLVKKGFKGGSAKAAKEFAQEAADAAIKQRELISTSAIGAAEAVPVKPFSEALDIAGKAIKEGDDELGKALSAEASRLGGGAKTLEQLEDLKRGLNRKITDAARNPNMATTMQQQFWKAAVKDIDNQILERLPEANRNIYKALGKDVSVAIKAKKPLAKLASKAPITQVDAMLAGAGGVGYSQDTSNPWWLAPLLLKKGLTSPTLMSKAAVAAPYIGGAVAPAAGLSAYQLLQQRLKGDNNE